MPMMKVHPSKIMMEPVVGLRGVKMPKRRIHFPNSALLSRQKKFKDFGGPGVNETPENINYKEAAKKGAAGAAGGAVVGAIIGSFIPFVGPALGAWAGAGLAGAFGLTAGAATDDEDAKDSGK